MLKVIMFYVKLSQNYNTDMFFFIFHLKITGGNQRHKKTEQYGEVNTHEDSNDTSKHGNSVATSNGSVNGGGQPGQGMPSKVTKVKNNEKTLLLSSDDEFQ